MMDKVDCILYSGGARGAEATFGEMAEKHEITEVNFTFEGHNIVRERGLRVLTPQELQEGDVSLAYISKLMGRRYTESPQLRKIFQTIWYQINRGAEIFIVGQIMDDGTVRGGTGWGAEFAKLHNKTLHVFDQSKDAWFSWNHTEWHRRDEDNLPKITKVHFTGSGTRNLEENGRKAIEALFARSFSA